MAGFKRGYDGKIAGLYDLDKTLGRGHFAVVKLARHVFTGEKVAVKVIDKTKLDTVATGHLFQEVRCMKLVQHPNIVRLYEVIDTQTKLYLILELGDGGDMFDYIMKHEEGLNEELAKKYFAQIVHAISYCHRLHVVHRDLKPENVVFFEKQGLVKLTDFGFSNKFQPGKKLTTSCGSLAYSAPEILLGDEYDAPAVDIWSLGVILFMLVCGQPPFQEANDSETLTMIMDCKYTVPPHVSSTCKDLIDRMLQRDPKQRASLEEIESHAWLQGVDPSPATKYSTPLVSHKNLSEEEHNSIIQRMVLGDIADRETIVEALETNKYNHITATYYLLAERILREKQEKDVQTRSSSPSNIKAHFRQSWPTRVDMHQDIEDSLAASSISHAGGPQSPARSAENLLNGHRSKAMMELGRREESTVTDSPGSAQGVCAAASGPAPGTIRAPTPSTSAAAKQRTCLFRVREGARHARALRRATTTPRATGGAWIKTQASATAGTGGTAVKGHLAARGGTVEAAAQGRGSPPQREEAPLAQTGGVLEREVTGEVRVAVEEGGGGGGGNKGQDSPSSCCNNSSTTNPSLGSQPRASRTASRSAELVESLKLMSLCLSSQLQHHHAGRGGRGGGGGEKFIIDPRSLSGGSVKIQEKSTWRMCIGSTGSLDTITLPTTTITGLPRTHATQHHHNRKTAPHSGPGGRNTHSNLSTLKNSVIQLPLCEKTISVNIQRGGGSRDGLLCTSAPASCCQVI
ncbi:hypothetical protein ACER0C_017326 [Sarotherodon galilaeus]